ncbi:MAG: DUF1294 domain-containing protein [Stenotrophomonas sp.]|uniref:DUF1294 domain-containing protein n=1 Tax=Stenotrophomonas sp. TaxID=69392 RepID=UPI003D6D06F0
MRYQGRLQDWNDDKGFGFVVPNGGGDRAFVHIKAFERTPQRPANGLLISYEQKKDARGRFNATAIRFAATSKVQAAAKPSGPAPRLPRTTLGLLTLLAVTLAWMAKFIPDWAMLTISSLSLLALIFYLSDKAAAQGNRWRTPESTLHLIALLGGWPGALLAQGLFNHKTSKRNFQRVFWVTVVFNILGVIALVTLKDTLLTTAF